MWPSCGLKLVSPTLHNLCDLTSEIFYLVFKFCIETPDDQFLMEICSVGNNNKWLCLIEILLYVQNRMDDIQLK